MFKTLVNSIVVVDFFGKIFPRTIASNGRDRGNSPSNANRRNSADQTFGTWEKWLVLLTWFPLDIIYIPFNRL